MARVFLGLGSNLDAEANIRAGLQRLTQDYCIRQQSPWYRSPALGFDGPEFINLVVEIEVANDITPAHLAQQLKMIETEFGRPANATKYSSRHLDIDILLFDEQVGEFSTSAGSFSLPRDDIWKYAFVLTPLLDIAPDLICPKYQQPLRDFKNNIQGQLLGLVDD